MDDEQQLVEAARRGDARAYAALVRAHQRSLYCTAYSILGSSWDASDAVQDALLQAWARTASLRDSARFKPWLVRILVNACFDTLSARHRVVPVGEEPRQDAARTEAHEFVGTEDQLDLFRVVRELEDEQRIVVALRYFCDLKVDDIAAILGVPPGTVKSRINRALARLAQQLGRATRLEVEP
jgi:RNA polymerase sigma-70 factor, ECF subfamily